MDIDKELEYFDKVQEISIELANIMYDSALNNVKEYIYETNDLEEISTIKIDINYEPRTYSTIFAHCYNFNKDNRIEDYISLFYKLIDLKDEL